MGEEWIYHWRKTSAFVIRGSRDGKRKFVWKASGPIPNCSGGILKGCFHGAVSKGWNGGQGPRWCLREADGSAGALQLCVALQDAGAQVVQPERGPGSLIPSLFLRQQRAPCISCCKHCWHWLQLWMRAGARLIILDLRLRSNVLPVVFAHSVKFILAHLCAYDRGMLLVADTAPPEHKHADFLH